MSWSNPRINIYIRSGGRSDIDKRHFINILNMSSVMSFPIWHFLRKYDVRFIGGISEPISKSGLVCGVYFPVNASESSMDSNLRHFNNE